MKAPCTIDADHPASRQDCGMKAIMNHWNDANVMKTEKLKADLAKTTAQVSSVISSLTLRSEKLDNLMNLSNDLADSAAEVQKVAQEVYCAMLKRYYKWWAMFLGGLTLLVLLIVAAEPASCTETAVCFVVFCGFVSYRKQKIGLSCCLL